MPPMPLFDRGSSSATEEAAAVDKPLPNFPPDCSPCCFGVGKTKVVPHPPPRKITVSSLLSPSPSQRATAVPSPRRPATRCPCLPPVWKLWRRLRGGGRRASVVQPPTASMVSSDASSASFVFNPNLSDQLVPEAPMVEESLLTLARHSTLTAAVVAEVRRVPVGEALQRLGWDTIALCHETVPDGGLPMSRQAAALGSLTALVTEALLELDRILRAHLEAVLRAVDTGDPLTRLLPPSEKPAPGPAVRQDVARRTCAVVMFAETCLGSVCLAAADAAGRLREAARQRPPGAAPDGLSLRARDLRRNILLMRGTQSNLLFRNFENFLRELKCAGEAR